MSFIKHPMRTLCVFCGAKHGRLPNFAESATELGTHMAKNNIGLVYGGSGLGIMSAIAEAVIAGGGHVTGVIPHHLLEKESGVGPTTRLYVVKSMHDRKSLMYRLADGFVALPGGLGTMDELMEVLTWAKLGIQRKPIALLNVNDYFTPLLSWLDHTVDSGFVDQADIDQMRIADTPEDVIRSLWEQPELVASGASGNGRAR